MRMIHCMELNSSISFRISGYCRDAMTQVVISGMKILPNGHVEDIKAFLGSDASGEDKLAGECTACGKWAGSIVERLERSNVLCKTGALNSTCWKSSDQQLTQLFVLCRS